METQAEKLTSVLGEFIEGENRNFQVGRHDEIVNVERQAQGYVVREGSINGIIQSVGDAKTVASDLVQYGRGVVEVEVSRWKEADASLKEILLDVKGFPKNITAELLKSNVSRYRVVGQDRLEFLVKDENVIRNVRLENHPYMSKETKKFALEQAARGAVQTPQMNLTLGG